MRSLIGKLVLVVFAAGCGVSVGRGGHIVNWGALLNADSTGSYSTGLVSTAGTAISNAKQIEAGFWHGLSLGDDGSIVCFGVRQFGLATMPEDVADIKMIRASESYSIALKNDGTILEWGESPTGGNRSVESVPRLKFISAGSFRWIGVTETGRLFDGISASPSITNLASAAIGRGPYGRMLGLREDGTLVHWGREPEYSYMVPPAGLSNVVAIAQGYNHSLALLADGVVVGWGGNASGQATGVPTPAVENPHRTASGLVIINDTPLKNVTAIAASKDFSLALKRDGTLVAWGSNEYRRCDIPAGLSNVVAIAAGEMFCLAITTNAAVAERFRR